MLMLLKKKPNSTEKGEINEEWQLSIINSNMKMNKTRHHKLISVA